MSLRTLRLPRCPSTAFQRCVSRYCRATSAKRFTGRRYDEVSSEAKAVSFDVVPGPDGMARFDVRGKLYAPEEISALILRKLAEDAGK